MKNKFQTFFVTVFISLSAISNSLAQDAQTTEKLDASAIYERAAASVVSITSVDERGRVSFGSGVVLRADGIIATNLHVILKSVGAQIQFSNGDIYDDVAIIDTDERKDIAILKIKATNLVVLPVANSNIAKIGATVYTIGSPKGLQGSLSNGIISSFRAVGEINPEMSGFRVIQFTAPVSPGSSGGALLDDSGQLVGLVFAEKSGGQNLNVAIPVNYVAPLALNAAGDGRRLGKMPATENPPTVVEKNTEVASGQDEFEYGSLSELKGVRRIFIDTQGETLYRDRLIKEIEREKLKIQIVTSIAEADCAVLFRNEMIYESWYSGSSAIVEKSKGTGLIVIPGTSTSRPRLLHKFNETKDSWFEEKPYVKFAKMFVKAYKEANK